MPKEEATEKRSESVASSERNNAADSNTSPLPALSSRLSTASNTSASGASDGASDAENEVRAQYQARRRAAHLQAEQKRRNAIKTGYDELKELLPPFPNDSETTLEKATKATIQQRAIDYILSLRKQSAQAADRVQRLRTEVTGIEIMQEQLEQFVTEHVHGTTDSHASADDAQTAAAESDVVTDKAKVEFFSRLVDRLSDSFEECVDVSDFSRLSGTSIHWLERHCAPLAVEQLGQEVLREVLPLSSVPRQHGFDDSPES